MKRSFRIISVFLLLGLILFAVLVSCNKVEYQDPPTPKDTETQNPVTEPKEEYFEPIPEGYNQITFYWNHNDTYENCDVWAWWGDVAGKGYVFHECEYGAKAVVNVPEGITEVGFIVRKNCSDPGGTSWGSATKDYESDRFALIEGKETFVYLKPGVPDQYKSNDGGKTLFMLKEFTMAGMVDENKIEYRISPKANITDPSKVKVYEGDREIEIVSISSLNKEVTNGIITLAEPLDLAGNYRVEIEGYGAKEVVPTDIFDSDFFANNYHYDGGGPWRCNQR